MDNPPVGIIEVAFAKSVVNAGVLIANITRCLKSVCTKWRRAERRSRIELSSPTAEL
jgi:hypothetical protein